MRRWKWVARLLGHSEKERVASRKRVAKVLAVGSLNKSKTRKLNEVCDLSIAEAHHELAVVAQPRRDQ